MIRPDGTERPVTHAAKAFIEELGPYKERLMNAYAPAPKIAIWKSRKNEIYQFAAYRSLNSYADSIDSYTDALHALNHNFAFIDHKMLTEQALDGSEAYHNFDIEPRRYAEDRYVREAMFGGAFGAFGTEGCHFFDRNHPAYLRIAAIA